MENRLCLFRNPVLYFLTHANIVRKDSIETTVKNTTKEERFPYMYGERKGKTVYESLFCIFSLLQTSFWKSVSSALASLPARGWRRAFFSVTAQ